MSASVEKESIPIEDVDADDMGDSIDADAMAMTCVICNGLKPVGRVDSLTEVDEEEEESISLDGG